MKITLETERLIITEFTMDMAEHKASIKVMERCGFALQFEGLGPDQGEERNICKFLYTL